MERPILFNTAMVQAIMAGNKTQTRRIVKRSGNTPDFYKRNKFHKLVDQLNNKTALFAGFYKDSDVFMHEGKEVIDALYFKAPCQVGDVLWVRETWQHSECFDSSVENQYCYKEHDCDREMAEAFKIKWKPSIHMPRKAARIFLKVINVRCERLQDITDIQALSEGVKQNNLGDHLAGIPIKTFAELWESLKPEAGYTWFDNPWVWVIEFKRVEGLYVKQ